MKYCQFGVSPVNHSDSDPSRGLVTGNESYDRVVSTGSEISINHSLLSKYLYYSIP